MTFTTTPTRFHARADNGDWMIVDRCEDGRLDVTLYGNQFVFSPDAACEFARWVGKATERTLFERGK